VALEDEVTARYRKGEHKGKRNKKTREKGKNESTED